ncbi:conserved hypothetical protein [Halorhabdus utahensis DSM 12940]|uniref:DUF7978 domain-containing protein n=1 Tax=Halorhabdus utahensis (strain DSM 12940 / JCM 11049 / AX-2) TaxID=519442 RepID=C7NRN2_HALUD|nr:hypothetical protein [Halorhabdus utahensis]ACV11968.1 conserved hypothetical protein [Halorhabdus utahensis DSM 12940]
MVDGSAVRKGTVLRGAAGGAIAFALGYLLTWILAGTRVANVTANELLGGAIPDWNALVWVFYDAHFVGTRTPEVFGPDGFFLGGGDLVDTVSLLGVESLYLVPVIVLAVGGAVVATRADTSVPRDGAMVGATLAVGYFAAVFLGLFPATHSGIAPSPLRALVIAGIVYPIVFGAIGGGLAGLYRQRVAGRTRGHFDGTGTTANDE